MAEDPSGVIAVIFVEVFSSDFRQRLASVIGWITQETIIK
jgi:hypothetical protein